MGVNGAGVITLVNTSAQELLGLSERDVGRPVGEVPVHGGVAEFLASAEDSDPTLIVVGDRTLVLTRRRTYFDGRQVGTVTTMVDRSDLLALQSQVSAQASITDACGRRPTSSTTGCTRSPGWSSCRSTTRWSPSSPTSTDDVVRSAMP